MTSITECFEANEQKIETHQNATYIIDTLQISIVEPDSIKSAADAQASTLCNNGNSIDWELIAICSGVGMLLLVIVIISIVCIIRCVKHNRRRRIRDSTSDIDASTSLIKKSTYIRDDETFGKETISKNTNFMSITLTKELQTNPTFNHQSFKQTMNSQTDRFSINSNDMGDKDPQRIENIRGRASEHNRNVKLLQNQQQEKNQSIVSRNKRGLDVYKNLKKNKNDSKQVKLNEDIKEQTVQENKEKMCTNDNFEEFSIDTFLDKRWERKKTHHSPDEVLQKPKRKSKWKCDLKDLEPRKMRRQFTKDHSYLK